MQCSDVDPSQDDEKIRLFGKGQRERTVLLAAAPESIRLLRRHLKHSRITAGSVFRGNPRYGGSPLPLDYSVIRKAWSTYCQAAGVQTQGFLVYPKSPKSEPFLAILRNIPKHS